MGTFSMSYKSCYKNSVELIFYIRPNSKYIKTYFLNKSRCIVYSHDTSNLSANKTIYYFILIYKYLPGESWYSRVICLNEKQLYYITANELFNIYKLGKYLTKNNLYNLAKEELEQLVYLIKKYLVIKESIQFRPNNLLPEDLF